MLVTTISAPVVNRLSLLRVTLNNGTSVRHSSASFGTFGYCILDAAADNGDSSMDWCSGRHIGYSPAYVVAASEGTDFSAASSNTADGLTRAMVLHPVACAIAFIAFLLAILPGVVGSLAGSITAFIAFVLSLVAMAVDFTWCGIIRNHVNDQKNGDAEAHFDAAIWCILAATSRCTPFSPCYNLHAKIITVLLFFGMFIVLFTCCANRRAKRRERVVVKNDYGHTGRPRRRWFGRRRV